MGFPWEIRNPMGNLWEKIFPMGNSEIPWETHGKKYFPWEIPKSHGKPTGNFINKNYPASRGWEKSWGLIVINRN